MCSETEHGITNRIQAVDTFTRQGKEVKLSTYGCETTGRFFIGDDVPSLG